MRPSPKQYVAKWDDTVVVDVYEDGDYMMVVDQGARPRNFRVMSETELHCFFRKMPDSEVEPDDSRCAQ